jgi:hypothetical protein
MPIVPKKYDSLRVGQDFRELNSTSSNDRYSMKQSMSALEILKEQDPPFFDTLSNPWLLANASGRIIQTFNSFFYIWISQFEWVVGLRVYLNVQLPSKG